MPPNGPRHQHPPAQPGRVRGPCGLERGASEAAGDGATPDLHLGHQAATLRCLPARLRELLVASAEAFDPKNCLINDEDLALDCGSCVLVGS
jgi:hypothetical protein